MVREEDPLCVYLVISGSRGQRMLFRYSFQDGKPSSESGSSGEAGGTPKRVKLLNEDTFQNPYRLKNSDTSSMKPSNQTLFTNGLLYGFTDAELATLLAPKTALCNQKFELKIGHVKLLGYPVVVMNDDTECDGFQDILELSYRPSGDVMINMVNVVIAINANADPRITIHYQNVCMMLAKALRHEEKRVRYLSNVHEIVIAEMDLLQELPESEQNLHQRTFARSQLAKDFVKVFHSICDFGMVNVAINGWLRLAYCFPHKIHKPEVRNTMVDNAKFNQYIRRIKPYHTLLLIDENDGEQDNLIKILPEDASPVLLRLIKLSNTVKNFQTLCQDADISLPQIFQIVAHLIYWGKCIVIYPLAESNVYVISESSPTAVDSKYNQEFSKKFPNQSLHSVFQKFSFPITLNEYRNPLSNEKQAEHAHIVTWLLKKRLIKQLHTYVYIVPISPKILENDIDEFDAINSFQENCNFKAGQKRIFDSFSTEEQLSLVHISYSVDREDMEFFFTMCKYFRGECHLENIMYYENVSRSKLMILIDKFRSILVTVQHEDCATMQVV